MALAVLTMAVANKCVHENAQVVILSSQHRMRNKFIDIGLSREAMQSASQHSVWQGAPPLDSVWTCA